MLSLDSRDRESRSGVVYFRSASSLPIVTRRRSIASSYRPVDRPVDRWALPPVFDVLALLALGAFLLAFAETSSSVQSIRIQKSRNTSDKEFAKKKWKGTMEEKRGTLEATAESTAVSVGRSGKIRQERAVSETKSEERCH